MNTKEKNNYNKMLEALQLISKSDKINLLQKNSEKNYWLSYEEALEMSYENLQEIAKFNIKWIRKIWIENN